LFFTALLVGILVHKNGYVLLKICQNFAFFSLISEVAKDRVSFCDLIGLLLIIEKLVYAFGNDLFDGDSV
jgi:hypothetical protein